ncbi:SWI/SNF chromatin-remodeling complex subunit [Orbilia oligospora]|uniref:SWI/SNF chromatin-remodeling complex subunit n=1 Tax=Orbilia oligospora TaxID=2813651 RepID=A0A7C8TWB2_ORBOL|nr:SWI/SNF chromatin-remodeling complex subunit [Orbilia oligospora]KAF3195811.1 SWI/SNF chromatin-remodeling complex subunit [Orbilia oligospora]KAF3266390.1 SWI/SNF chromatin-remodeling complex subunit [Orbilia oligospora]KAF3266391.1 SWI/SNF chromatin-remodeling complex subunit, variant 2 [Orbilia oligospora]KAF3272273.1 SWI/SNF chromatin-remodeling complex subunit [Orbilia oligospora]
MLAIGPSMQQHSPTPPGSQQHPQQQQQQPSSTNPSPHPPPYQFAHPPPSSHPHPYPPSSASSISATNPLIAASGSTHGTPYIHHQQLPTTSSSSSPNLSNSSIPHAAIPHSSFNSLGPGNVSPLPPTNGFANQSSTRSTPVPDPSLASPIKSQTPNPPTATSSPKLSVEELKARAKSKGKQPASARHSPVLKEEDAADDAADKSDGGSSSNSSNNSPKKLSKKRPTQKELLLDQYVNRDLLHAAALSSQSHAHLDLIRSKRREIESYKLLREERRANPASVFGYGYQGYGNAFTDGKTRILYPVERKRPGGRRARELQISRSAMKQQAETTDDLLPIRLDVHHDKIRLRDTFLWNLHERCIPIELFAEHLVEDYHLPISHGLVAAISKQIVDQVTDYHPHIFLEDTALDPQLPYSAYKNDDMRILIKINVTIGEHTLTDQFEWDVNCPENSPEEFAQCLTREMSLSGEFATAIAHQIREQSQLYTKYLYFVGYPFDGRPIEDEDLRSSVLPSPLNSVLRPAQQVREFTPQLWIIPELELEQQERKQSREARKNKRRLNRRGGPALPDLKDVPKTRRTQIVSTILPGAVEKASDMKIYKDKIPGESESESEDSEPPSPQQTPHLLSTMTRRQRTAAVAAASALRNSAARSATPEVSGDFHTPTRHVRSSAPQWERRPHCPPGADSIVVKLKIDRSKLQEFENQISMMAMQHQMQSRSQGRGPLAQPPITPLQATPVGMMYNTPSGPPPPAPDFGMMLGPVGQTNVPAWVENGLAALRQSYPSDQFEGIMRQVVIDTTTGISVPHTTPMIPGRHITDYTPRIRCVDCPGKLYTPGPNETVENFEIHLRNRLHRERVEARIRGLPYPS